MRGKILKSLNKFNPNLEGSVVLTEAASGNYAVTPVIAAKCGAAVFALFKESKYGDYNQVFGQINNLAQELNVSNQIKIIRSYEEIDLSEIDILTNTGFNRPITKSVINRLSENCVIPLMWEPWEFRPDELDIDYCAEKGIKVYGTDESDERLRTMDYIGFIVLNFLLQEKRTPFSSNILVLGDKHFSTPIIKLLRQNYYSVSHINDYSESLKPDEYDCIVFAEHTENKLLLGENGFIKSSDLRREQLLIHIAGNLDVNPEQKRFKIIPKTPAAFGYMSFTTDFIDNMAVIDLHTASLKVAEGMLEANKLKLTGKSYKEYMENNYPALAFDNPKYW